MNRHQLAQINVARLLAPIEAPQIADFVAALEPVNALDNNGVVIDSANYAVERLMAVISADTRVVDAFITEQIGDLLACADQHRGHVADCP